jgi:hypothetical protein
MTCKFGSTIILMKGCNNMTKAVLAILVAAVLLPAVLALGQEKPPSYTFTSFDFPGAISTESVGINTAGFLVGAYSDAAGVVHGFERMPTGTGTFETIDYPGAVSTALTRINDANQAVGSFVDASGISHGFLFISPNQFTQIDYPRAAQTQVYGINNSQQIVGLWYDANGNTSGFSLLKKTFTDLVFPGSVSTVASDVNLAGEVSGSWGNTIVNDQAHGFLLTSAIKGKYSDVDFPGAEKTLIYGLNDLNQVVGAYVDAAGVTHGWAGQPSTKQFLTVDFPGSTGSDVAGITNNDNLTGTYTDSLGMTHGFWVCKKPPNTQVPGRLVRDAGPPPAKGHCPG